MRNKGSLFLKLLMLTIIVGTVIISCAMKRPQAITQGIEGHIYQLTGNQMPMKGKVPSKPKGIKAEVWIYEGATPEQAQGATPLYNKVNTRLAAKVASDTTGHYQAQLPPGKYSIFIKQGDQLFAAEMDGGSLTPATVTAGKVTERNVTVTLGAAF